MAGPRTTSRCSRISSSVRPCQLGVLVGLVEVAGHDAGAEAHLAVVGDGPVAGEQPQEVALAGAVRRRARPPARRTRSRRRTESVRPCERQPLDRQAPCDRCGRRRGARRPAAPAPARAAWSAPRSAAGGSRPPSASARTSSEILARCRISRTSSTRRSRSSSHCAASLREAVVQAGLAGLVVGGEAAAVGPRALGLDGDDLGGGAGQQLAVVADEQDRLRAAPQLVLQPALARHVEEVVGLVEQQDVVRRRAGAPRARGASARRRSTCATGRSRTSS